MHYWDKTMHTLIIFVYIRSDIPEEVIIDSPEYKKQQEHFTHCPIVFSLSSQPMSLTYKKDFRQALLVTEWFEDDCF